MVLKQVLEVFDLLDDVTVTGGKAVDYLYSINHDGINTRYLRKAGAVPGILTAA